MKKNILIFLVFFLNPLFALGQEELCNNTLCRCSTSANSKNVTTGCASSLAASTSNANATAIYTCYDCSCDDCSCSKFTVMGTFSTSGHLQSSTQATAHPKCKTNH